MGSIPPLSLGPPVVRPLRMTVVRPFGKRTLMVLPRAGAVASSRTSSTADNFLTRAFSLVRGRVPEGTGAHHTTDAGRRLCFSTAAGVRYTWGKAKEEGESVGTRDLRQAGVPVLPAGAGLLQVEGGQLDGVRRAERPRAPRRDVRLLGRRPDRALHRRGRQVPTVRLRRPAARLNGARLAPAVCRAKNFRFLI